MKKTITLYFLLAAAVLFLAACNKGQDVPGGGSTVITEGAVTGVTLPATFSVVMGTTGAITATVEPADATNPKVNWASNNKAVATIDENGLVTGVSVGNATITVTTEDGNYTAKCAIRTEPRINVKGIDLLNHYFVDTKTKIRIEAKVVPENATDPTVVWTSGDQTIVRFDADGMVSGIKEGSTTITVRTNESGFSATAMITVNAMGQTSFRSPTLWTIGSQIWSDEVTAQGYKEGKYMWKTVNMFKDQICPNGWRVPTKRDFCELDKTINSRAECDDRDDPEAINRYREMFIPYMNNDGCFFWSQDLIDDENILREYFKNPEIYEGMEFSWGFHLEPYHFYMVIPNKILNREGELSVRCIKDAI